MAAKRSAAARQELAGPACPPAAEHIWAWFLALDAGRGSSGFGPEPIGWAELEAFGRLQGVQMSALEAGWIRALDRAALAAAAEKKK